MSFQVCNRFFRAAILWGFLVPAAWGQTPIPQPSDVPAGEELPKATEGSAEDPAIDDTDTIIVDVPPTPLNMDDFLRAVAYPKAARRANVEGRVVVRILIDTTGSPIGYKLLESPHELLTEAVENNIWILRFSLAISDGKPIKCWVNVPVKFTLH